MRTIISFSRKKYGRYVKVIFFHTMLIYMEMNSILKCFRRLDLSTFLSLSLSLFDILITPSVSLYQASETRYVKIDGSR